MAELQKLLQANGTFKSELMQAFLSAAQQSFREHSKTGQNRSSSSTSSSKVSAAPPPSIAGPLPPLPSDVNLNPDPKMFDQGLGGLSNLGSPTGSLQSSPYPDLSMANFSPLDGADFSNSDIFDNKMFQMSQGAMNFNSNAVYSPGNDNLSPPLDNLDPCSPSTFLTFTNKMRSPDSSNLEPPHHNSNLSSLNGNSCANINSQNTINSNINNGNTSFNMGATPDLLGGGSTDTPDNIRTLNMNAALMSPSTSNMMMPQGIKQEVDPMSMANMNLANANMQLGMGGMGANMGGLGSMGSMGGMLIKQEPLEDFDDDQVHLESSANLEEVARIMAEVRTEPSQERLLLIDQVTDAIIDAHMATTVGTRQKVADAFERLSGTITPEGMPDISKLSVTPPKLWQKFLESMVPEIQKVVRFSRKLPGFAEVSQEDQIKLIKQGSFEVMCARHSVLINCEKDTMLDPSLSCASPRVLIKQLPMGPFLDEIFMIASQVNPLQLTDGEMGMLAAVLLICPCRKDIDNPQAIRTIQRLYQQALYLLMKHLHKDYDKRFQSLMMLIPLFQKVNNDHAKHLNNIKMINPSEFDKQFPPLHKEVFENDTTDSANVQH